MASKSRAFKLAMAFGLAGMMSSQSVAAFAAAPGHVDPLVALSALGTPQSRAAVCGGDSVRINGVAQVTHAALRTDCSLPVTNASMTTAADAQPAPPYEAPAGFAWVPVLVGGVLVLTLVAIIISNNNNGDGNLTPVSPP